MVLKKKRKTNSGASVSDSLPLTYDSPSSRSSSTSTASASMLAATQRSSACSALSGSGSVSGSSSPSPSDSEEGDEAEGMDVMGTPAALAPSTLLPAQLRLAFTPSVRRDAEGGANGAEDSTFRRLNFTTKECATPGRYDARHKLGQPLAVYCRIKPMLASELADAEEQTEGGSGSGARAEKIMTVESDTSLLCTAPDSSALFRHGELTSKFTFTRILGPDSTQEEVYLHTTKPMVDAFYEGQNGLIFAYGITASGKTYSMQGTTEAPGIIPRIVLDVFQKVMSGAPTGAAAGAEGADGFGMTGTGSRYTVKASYLEIYNESINDLLVEPTTKAPATARGTKTRGKAAAGPAVCRLQQNGTGANDETSVVNLREVEIRNHREALALLEQGQANRTIHETTLNADSSRSHSVFTLKLVHPNGAVYSRLSVVDLAGSERTKRVSHAANTAQGTRMRETVNINQSLLVLGRCLEALRYNQNAPRKLKVVPFRESAITRLFKDSLSGWGRTVMLTAASQNPADYDETVHALKYAAVAKEVRVILHKVDTHSKTRARTARASTSTANASSSRASAGVKRQASQPLLDLDDAEHTAAASSSAAAAAAGSSWDADDGTNPPYDDLLHECFLLKQRVVELELAAARTEEAVREELTSQQEQLLDEMEQSWMERLERERSKAEEKNKKLFAIWQLEYKAQMQQQMQQAAADAKENMSAAESNTSKVLRGLRSK